MYTRVVTYKFKSENFDEANARLGDMRSEIMSIPGLKHWIMAADDELSCIVVAVYEDKAACDAAAPKSKELFGRFAEEYAEPPTASGYEVLYMESNA